MIEPPLKRIICNHCQRPARSCICAFIRPLSNKVELLLLQHPEETRNAKNTAGLLHLSLQNSQLLIGEEFAEDKLISALYADTKQPLLLYPELAEYQSLGLPPPAPPLALDQYSCSQLRLVVLDGTWRKSRKLLYLNRPLQKLPLLSLTQTPESLYKIRKAHSENQLSTLEASCYALQQLEQNKVDYAPLLLAMVEFVAQLAAFIPPPPNQ